MTKKDYKKCWGPSTPWKTESAWLGWLRGGIRRVWNKHPLKIAFIQHARIKIANPNPISAKRFPEIWGGKCACCGGIFPLSGGKKEGKQRITLQVDHKHPAGSLRKIEDIQSFFVNMLCITLDDLQFACTECNKTRSLADKLGISFEEADANRQAIQIIKDKQDKLWLLDHNILPASAQANRRKQIVEAILKGK